MVILFLLLSGRASGAPLEMSDAGTTDAGTAELSVGASGTTEPAATVEAAVGATERWELATAVGFEDGITVELASKVGLANHGALSLATEVSAALPMAESATEFGLSAIATVELGPVTSTASAMASATADSAGLSAGTLLSLSTPYVQPALEVVADLTAPERSIRTGASLGTTVRGAVVHLAWQHDFDSGDDTVWAWLTLSWATGN